MAWVREEPNVLDIQRLKYYNKHTNTHTHNFLKFEFSNLHLFPVSLPHALVAFYQKIVIKSLAFSPCHLLEKSVPTPSWTTRESTRGLSSKYLALPSLRNARRWARSQLKGRKKPSLPSLNLILTWLGVRLESRRLSWSEFEGLEEIQWTAKDDWRYTRDNLEEIEVWKMVNISI